MGAMWAVSPRGLAKPPPPPALPRANRRAGPHGRLGRGHARALQRVEVGRFQLSHPFHYSSPLSVWLLMLVLTVLPWPPLRPAAPLLLQLLALSLLLLLLPRRWRSSPPPCNAF